jgi:acetylornithine deacetylase/succinyl-diaminopimelate desuccinylase-like protein
MAKVSMRLVPGQDPDKIGDLFEAYVARLAPKTVTIQITRMHGGRPWVTNSGHPFIQAAGRAMEHGFGKRPVFTREGGSNGIVSVFQDVLGAPTLMLGIGLPDENAHAPNEHLDLANYQRGIIAAAHLYQEMC